MKKLLQIQGTEWKHLTGTLWCDNKGAVQKFNELEDGTPFSLTIANQTNADILQELRVVKNELPVEVQAAWVKSHQEQCNTRETRINNVVDCLAGHQHEKKGAWALSETSKMLPNTQAQLIVAGRRYTGPIHRKVQYHMYNEKSKRIHSCKVKTGGYRTYGRLVGIGCTA